MLMIRISAALISMIVLVDFTWTTSHQIGLGIALIPALSGSIIALVIARKDAVEKRERWALATAICFLTLMLVASFGFALEQNASKQTTLLAALGACGLIASIRALLIARKRRRRSGIYAYYNQ